MVKSTVLLVVTVPRRSHIAPRTTYILTSDQLLLVTRSATGSRGSGAGAEAARAASLLWRAQPAVASGWATHQAIAKSRTNRIGDCVIGVLASLPSP